MYFPLAWAAVSTGEISSGSAQSGRVLLYIPAAILARCEPELSRPQNLKLYTGVEELLEQKGVNKADEWARATLLSLCANQLPLTPAHTSLVLAVVEKESSFNVRGLLPDQPHAWKKLVYRLVDDLIDGKQYALKKLPGGPDVQRFAALAISAMKRIGLVDTAKIKKRFDRYYERFGWKRIKTEWDIENVVTEDVLEVAHENSPVGIMLRGLLAANETVASKLRDKSLFQSVGSMQTNFGRAYRYSRHVGNAFSPIEVRQHLYEMTGGLYYGIRDLRRLVDIYGTEMDCRGEAVQFIVADYTGGPFASRNFALLGQIELLTGKEFGVDVKLSDPVVKDSLRNLARAAAEADTSKNDKTLIEAFFRKTNQRTLEKTDLYRFIKVEYERKSGAEPGYARLPRRCNFTPKNGLLCLSDVARKVHRRFQENCRAIDRELHERPAEGYRTTRMANLVGVFVE